MEINLAELLRAIAALLWPLIVILLLIIFRKAVTPIIESAKSRKFTVKVGEMEVSMEEYNRQQSELIKDLQNQMVALQKAVDEAKGRESKEALPITDYSVEKRPATRSVLWIGDNPEKNAVMLQNLMDAGIHVSTARSSREGLASLRARNYDKVVTDMDHPDEPAGQALAGIRLVKTIRQMNENLPVYIFTSGRKAEELFDEASDAGANQITGSPTILLALLKG